ncbi:MAG: inorganic diphosphatase [Clostridia bacterium]|nr:inorganic diphosphatase [Clostridia bacterium]
MEERKQQVKGYLGQIVRIEIDRPIGYVHHKREYSLTYPINYGYIPGVLGGDGEELDVYLMGVNEAVTEYTGRIVGIVHRENDVEDKLIMAPTDQRYTAEEIAETIQFQERYYRTYVEALFAED